MRVLVCGGRDYTDHVTVNRRLGSILFKAFEDRSANWKNFTIIHGGARGADTLAGLFAKMFGLMVDVYPADWEADGKAAGFIRNQRMLELGQPDLVAAFSGGAGTADMVRRARKAGVEVVEVL